MMWFYGIQSLTIEIEIKSADWEKQKPHTRNNNEIQLGQKLLQCSHQIGAHRMGSVLVNSTFSLSFPTLRLLSATIERERFALNVILLFWLLLNSFQSNSNPNTLTNSS